MHSDRTTAPMSGVRKFFVTLVAFFLVLFIIAGIAELLG
jgi:hypothetical protein